MRECLLVVLSTAMLAVLSACGQKTSTMEDFETRPIILPDGQVVRVEVMIRREDMLRGMMFRESLAPDRGMLFMHGSAGTFPYYMFQVRMPLDIIWMNKEWRVVEVALNIPPCPAAKAKDCPTYGGHENAQFVLELRGGTAARHGVTVGSSITF
jgi:uncharacterized protein